MTDTRAPSTGSTWTQWTDVDGRAWQVMLSPERIVVTSEEASLDIPQASWGRDLYTANHGSRTIVRFETYDCSARFLLEAEEAEPLLALLEPAAEPEAAPVEEATPQRIEHAGPLLWPKVSPLAVWALACSALAFIPVVGLLPAVATVILLVLHRSMVKRAAAWRHSRSLCLVAGILLAAGLTVSAASVWCASLPKPPQAAILSVPDTGDATNWGIIIAGLLVVLVSLTVHEAAHAITAWWLGDSLARSLGRVTLNPLAHIDLFGTILLPIFLVLAKAPVFGYARPVPVRVESLPRHRRAHILISLAGPGSNLLLAAASLMLLLGLGCMIRLAVPEAKVGNFSGLYRLLDPVMASGFAGAALFATICTTLKLSFLINTILAIFNLIPIPPLDGSWVLEHLFPLTLGRLYAAIRPYGFLIFLVAIYSDLFKFLFYPLALVLGPGLGLLELVTGL